MGTFIPHSVLGSSEDYINTLQSTGMVRVEKRKLCNPSEIFLLKFSHQSLLDCYSSPPLPLPLSLTTPCNTHSPLRLDQLQHSPSLHLWFCQEWRNPAPSWKRRATRRPLWWALRDGFHIILLPESSHMIKRLLYGTVDLSPWEKQLSAMTIRTQCSASLPVFLDIAALNADPTLALRETHSMKLSIFSHRCWINTHMHMYTHTRTHTHTATRNSCFETLEQNHGREKSPTRTSCRYVCVWLSPFPHQTVSGYGTSMWAWSWQTMSTYGVSFSHFIWCPFFVHVLSDTWQTRFEPYSPRCNPGSTLGYVTQIAIGISAFTRTRISLVQIGSRVKGLV